MVHAGSHRGEAVTGGAEAEQQPGRCAAQEAGQAGCCIWSASGLVLLLHHYVPINIFCSKTHQVLSWYCNLTHALMVFCCCMFMHVSTFSAAACWCVYWRFLLLHVDACIKVVWCSLSQCLVSSAAVWWWLLPAQQFGSWLLVLWYLNVYMQTKRYQGKCEWL